MATFRQCLLITICLTATLFTGAIRAADSPVPNSEVDVPAASPTTEKTSSTTPASTNDTTTVSPTTPPTTPPTTQPTNPPPITKPTTPPTTKPTTPPTPTTPSTPPPTPTTVAPPTTPAPLPSGPSTGKWNVTQGNQTCAVFQAAITINLEFVDKSNKTQHFNIYVPSTAHVLDAKCPLEAEENSFNLVWSVGNVAMHFAKNNTHYYLQKFESWINATVIPELANQTDQTNFSLSYVAGKDSTTLEGNVGSAYLCQSPAAIKMNNGTVLTLASVTYQAFIKDPSGKLGPVQNCVTDSSPDMVPILVAGGLILFVILVLVAYIVTRRRQARGYHSM